MSKSYKPAVSSVQTASTVSTVSTVSTASTPYDPVNNLYKQIKKMRCTLRDACKHIKKSAITMLNDYYVREKWIAFSDLRKRLEVRNDTTEPVVLPEQCAQGKKCTCNGFTERISVMRYCVIIGTVKRQQQSRIKTITDSVNAVINAASNAITTANSLKQIYNQMRPSLNSVDEFTVANTMSNIIAKNVSQIQTMANSANQLIRDTLATNWKIFTEWEEEYLVLDTKK